MHNVDKYNIINSSRVYGGIKMKLLYKTSRKFLPLFFLLIFGLVCLFIFFNSDEITEKIKTVLINQLEEQFNGDIQIDSVTMFPLNRVTFHRVEVQNEQETFFQADRIVVSFHLQDLLRGVDGIIKGVKEIQLIDPVLNLASENNYGFEEFFQEKNNEQNSISGFAPIIRITNGSISYQDEIINEKVDRVNGQIKFNDSGIELDLKGDPLSLDQCQIAITGSLTPELEIDLKFAELPLAVFERYGFTIPQVQQLDGIGSGKISIKAKENNQFEYSGQFNIDTGSLELKDGLFAIRELKGNLTISNDLVKITSLSGNTDAGLIEVEGQITNFANPNLSLSVTTDRLKLEELIDLVPQITDQQVKGYFSGTFDVIGRLHNPFFKGNFMVGELEYGDLKFKNGTVNWRYQNSLLTLREVKFDFEKGRFAINSGHFNFNDSEENDIEKLIYSFNMDLENINLQGIFSELNLTEIPKGNLTGNFYLSGNGISPDSMNAIGNIKITNGAYQEMPFDKLEANFWFTEGELGISRMEFVSPYLFTFISGSVDLDNKIDLNIESSYVDLGWFGERFELSLDGNGTVQGEIKGTIANPYFIGDINLTDGKIYEQLFDNVSGQIELNQSELILSQTSISRDGADIELTGSVGFANEDFDLEVEIIHSSLTEFKEVLDFMDIPIDLAGDIAGKIVLEGSWSAPRVSGDIVASDGMVIDQPFSKADLSFRWQDNDIYFEDFMISYNNTQLEVSGSIDDYQTINLEMSGQDFDLKDIEQLRDHLPQIIGKANFRGKLTGELSSPMFWGTISTDSIVYNGLPIEQLSALLEFKDGILEIKPMKVINQGSEYTLTGQISFIDQDLELKIQNKHVQFADLLSYAGFSLKDLDYTVGGTIWVRGELNNPLLEMDAVVHDKAEGTLAVTGIYDLQDGLNLKLTGTKFDLSSFKSYIGTNELNYTLDGQIQLQGSLEKPSAELDIVLADQFDGRLNVSGLYRDDQEVELELTGVNFDLTPFKSLLPYELDYGGQVNVTGSIIGQLAKLTADLEVEVQNGSINNYGIEYLGGSLDLVAGQVVMLNQHLILPDGNQMTISGSVPFKNADSPLELDIAMTEGNLAILPLLIPDVEMAGGKGYGTLKLSGTLSKPLIEGEINISSGFLKIKGLDLLKEINGTILLQQNKATLEKIDALYGIGSVVLQGTLTLDGLVPDQINLNFESKNFKFTHGSVNTFGDGKLKISGDFLSPEIRGMFLIHDAEIGVIPFEWPVSEEEGIFKPTLYLELYPGDNVQVTGEGNMSVTVAKSNLDKLDSNTDRLIVDTTGEELILSGKLHSRSGTYNIYNSNFRVTRASAIFDKFNKVIPIINVTAETRIGDYQIFINLDGLPVDDNSLNIRLSSEPNLSHEEIVALLVGQGGLGELLVGGGDVSEIISDEIWRYINQGLRSEFLNKLEDSVEKALRLDTFYLDPILIGETKINVEIGKYLGENFYVVYNQTFSQNPERSYGFEYQIHSFLSLEGMYNDEGTYELNLKFDYPF